MARTHHLEFIFHLSWGPSWPLSVLKPSLVYPWGLLGPSLAISWKPSLLYSFGLFFFKPSLFYAWGLVSRNFAISWKPSPVYSWDILGPVGGLENNLYFFGNPNWLSYFSLGFSWHKLAFLKLCNFSSGPSWPKLAFLKPSLVYPWNFLGTSWLS